MKQINIEEVLITNFPLFLNRLTKQSTLLPVILTTDGFRATGVRYWIHSPIVLATCSFKSGDPFKIPSRNIGRSGERP